jgi:PAS domain S-box-containing protein
MAPRQDSRKVDVQPLASGQRVEAVRHALEDATGCEPMVGRLVRLLADAVQASVAMASLITADRQVLLGCHGLPGSPTIGSVLPLTWSLCRDVVVTGLPLIVHDSGADERFAANEAVLAHVVGAYAGFPVRGDDGQVIGVLDVAAPHPRHWSARELAIVDNAAQLFGELLVGANTTDARARTDVERQRAFLDALLDSLDTGVAACDAHGRLVLFNQAMRGFLGGAQPDDTPVEEWASRFGITHPDGRIVAAGEMPLLRSLAGETVRNVDLIISDVHGRSRWYTINAESIKDRFGDRLGAVTAMRDVTDERHAERFRRCEVAVAQAMVRSADLTQAGHAVLVALAETLGWPYAELWLHDPVSDTMRPAGQWRQPGVNTARTVPAQLTVEAGPGGVAWSQQRQPVWVGDVHAGGLLSADEAARSPLRAAVVVPVRRGEDLYGALYLFATAAERPSAALNVMLAGVAERLGQYLQRHRAEDLARQLARAKDNYSRLLSHELRTPLTSIAAYTELLTGLGDELPNDARQMLQAVTRNSDSLRGVVDDLLALDALDNGDTLLHIARLDLVTMIRDAINAASEAAADWRVHIITDLPDIMMIDGDDARLRQVIDALLSNAITYSHPGGDITITLTQTSDGCATLTITDSGIGVPTDELDRVFERFHRSSRVHELGIPGTGLALAISRVIVDRHHGSITLHPNAPGGTTATVRLPSRQPTQ